MAEQTEALPRNVLEIYRDKWNHEGGVATAGDIRDKITNMCQELDIGFDRLPSQIHDLLLNLRREPTYTEARLDTLLEAVEQAMDEAPTIPTQDVVGS